VPRVAACLPVIEFDLVTKSEKKVNMLSRHDGSTPLLSKQMCDYCAHVLSGATISHTRFDCQYRRSMYCYVCAASGHAIADCPNKIACAIRRGEEIHGVRNIVLDVEDSEESVKSVLRMHNISPGTRKIENRKLLRDLANSMKPPRLVQFIVRS
jgi:hypothetical protein